ncbi:MAG: D-alanine--D-alanine ligase [Spirochaetes bacterium]|nr:D-alanine--D-alanine ligase [Spirochaetota bacterium]
MGKKKINVGILFGGKSAEHEVSLQSAKNVYDAIDKEKYSPVLIGIDKTGRWLLNDSSRFLLNANDPKLIKLNTQSDSVALVPQSSGKISKLSGNNDSPEIDVVFPILHGPFGEDGTVQGLLKLANIPFVGAGVLGSAVGMDKDIMKRLLRDAGIPIGKYLAIDIEDEIPEFNKIKTEIGIPCFIKPANLGSSVGVSKVNNSSDYTNAVKNAFQYDTKIIIEEFIKGREIECAVLGNRKPIASVPGEIISTHDFYSYEAKYIDEKGAVLEIPANIPDETAQKIREIAVKTFVTLSCEGMGRVDSFLKDNGEIIVNEINTIPGFTKISMYPKLWEYSGIPYTELIDRLIQLSIERFNKEQKLKTSY